MRIEDMRRAVLPRLRDQLARNGLAHLLDPRPPGADPGKFRLAGLPARLWPPRDGVYLNVNPDWFRGSTDPARIRGEPFYWSVFLVRKPVPRIHVAAQDWLRRQALSFDGPTREHYRRTLRWRGQFHCIAHTDLALFRWGDETVAQAQALPDRLVRLDNAAEAVLTDPLAAPSVLAEPPAAYGGLGGGESPAHRMLKEYVADHPEVLGLPADARATLEHGFATGDRVDVLFENHRPVRTVVEVEVEGAAHLRVGVEQALKYRTLAAAEAGLALDSRAVAARVVAWKADYPDVRRFARRYGVSVVELRPKLDLVA